MRWLLVVALSLPLAPCADAQSASTFPPLDRLCESPWGHFTHHSGVEINQDHATDVDWKVCNLDPDAPLIFSWDAPAITLGDLGRLPFRMCADLSMTVTNPEKDPDASISYTQGSRSCPAQAYVSKPVDFIPDTIAKYLPHILQVKLRSWFHGGDHQPNYVPLQLDVHEVQDNTFISHFVSWDPTILTLAVPAAFFEGIPPEELQQIAKKYGYEIQQGHMGDFLNSESHLSSDRLSEAVFLITSHGGKSLAFDTRGSAARLTSQPITLIDPLSKSLVIDAKVNTFSRAE